MPIEFQCSNCRNVLKVGDEHAGKSARCPSCKAVTAIPRQNTTNFSSADTDPSLAQSYTPNPFSDPGVRTESLDPANPYRAPTTSLELPKIKRGPISPTTVSFGEIFEYAWACWRDNLGILIGMTVIVAVINFAISMGTDRFQVMLVQLNADEFLVMLTTLVLIFLSNVIAVFFYIGQIRICLNIARRQPAEITQLFSGADQFIPAAIASILFMFLFMFGLVLLIVPGILVLIYFWPFLYLISDNQTGPIESFGVASSIVRDNVGTTVMMGIAAIGLSIIGVLICLIGVFFTAPLIGMITAIGYLKMSGQL